MYTFKKSETALGVSYQFVGPGMSPYSSIHFLQLINDWAKECLTNRFGVDRTEYEASCVLGLLKAAYEAGRQAKAEEIRDVLGVKRH